MLFVHCFYLYGFGTFRLLFFPFLFLFLLFHYPLLILSLRNSSWSAYHRRWILKLARNRQVSGEEGILSIILNRVPSGSVLREHCRFCQGPRKCALAQPLEDISSGWNPLPPCWDHQKLQWKFYRLCWWWWHVIWSPHWCQTWVCHVHIAFQSCCKLDHAAQHWGSV